MLDILKTINLSKNINGKTLVNAVNMNVRKGEIYGFVGPNGAGKTTVMKMITNLWKPTDGKILLFGEELTPSSYELLKKIGSIIEFPHFYDHMSGKDNLQLHCDYMGKNINVDESLHMLGLLDAGDKPVKNYSLGMKQRLGIARAILCEPELLILDEPTNGLDPMGMKQIRDLLKFLCINKGMTIIISSHILSEVESIADTIGIINYGSMMEEISMKEISRIPSTYIELSVENVNYVVNLLKDNLDLEKFEVSDSIIRIYDSKISIKEMVKIIALNEVEISSISKQKGNLEDYYLKIIEGK